MTAPTDVPNRGGPRDPMAVWYDRAIAAESALAALRADAERLKLALKFYASARHLVDPSEWDSCSGEHSMWQFPEVPEETMVEGGWIAQQALDGNALTFLRSDGKLIDEDEDTAAIAKGGAA